MFGSALLRHEGVRGFGFGIGCSGVIQMTRDGRRQVEIGRIGVGTVTVVTDPANFPSDQMWHYGPKTRNWALCNHICNHHLSIYLDEAEKNSWPIIIKPVCDALTTGYTIATLHEAL